MSITQLDLVKQSSKVGLRKPLTEDYMVTCGRAVHLPSGVVMKSSSTCLPLTQSGEENFENFLSLTKEWWLWALTLAAISFAVCVITWVTMSSLTKSYLGISTSETQMLLAALGLSPNHIFTLTYLVLVMLSLAKFLREKRIQL